MYPEPNPNPYTNPQPPPQPHPQQNPYLSPQPHPRPNPYLNPPPQPPAQPNPYANQYAGPPANPEFLAADSRSGIVVDETGVTFDFEGQSAEFPWSDIQSVHSKPGSGHRLMVAVVLPGGKFYECVVKARNRVTLEQWFRDLGYVLHVYLGRRDNPAPWTP
ncbi:hypothetical protein [Streptomyces niveus]|uniref:Uncharacterized protein n=1 Tax=Streptomyces niveus TaxID=193462 RepID=A0A1U9QSI4_STRNV|nr:hypothetical protein [Streptomyces niveus]AQU66791.1 hypothetical protein BBN63_11575 [Streptomyces niveus]